jgi:hypothetical protein
MLGPPSARDRYAETSTTVRYLRCCRSRPLNCHRGRADVGLMATSAPGKRLRIRRPGDCVVCRRPLAVGEEAIWNRDSRTLTCLACAAPPPPAVTEGQAGTSALREYERRHAKREQYARDRFGGFGVFLSRVIDEPQSTKSWQRGGKAEVRTSNRLTKLLRDQGALLLHDRRIPRRGNANIDHIAVGPAGVLVIDTKDYRGRIRTERIGGLLSPRRTVLLVNGRDRTRLIDGVERQVGYVRDALDSAFDEDIEVRGALCFPNPDGLPLFGQLQVRDVVVDGPKPIAKLASQPGPLSSDTISLVWRLLGAAFPEA